MNNKILYIIISLLFFLSASAQNATETKINSFFDLAQKAQNDEQIKILNDSISLTLQNALNDENSFDYPFDNCQYLGKIYASDHKIRIYTWNLPLSDGTYIYGGFVQQNNGHFSRLTNEKSARPTERQILSAKMWYGALYYQAIAVKHKKSTYYVLLGWIGNNNITRLKIIDALRISKSGNMTFGNPVFYNEKHKILSRIIFEYGAQYQMTLKYNNQTKQIIFDHLAPSSPRMQGVFSEYGPDFSYDAFSMKKGKWNYKANVDARNEE